MKVVLIGVGLIIALIGVIMIVDARTLTKKWFSFGDQNEATNGIKIMGFLFAIIGVSLLMYNI